jgi:hypothetical protein
LHYEKYTDINRILIRTYFLNDPRVNDEKANTFTSFWNDFRIIDNICKPYINQELVTLAGDILVKREKKPIITKESVADADLILYQVSYALFASDSWKWFPSLYIYRPGYKKQSIWTRLQSKRHCEKLFPLFGAKSIEELKKAIGKCVVDREYTFRSMRYAAPNVLSSINLEEIGIRN